MKRYIFILLTLLTSTVVFAQSSVTHSQFVESLARPDGGDGARVNVKSFCNVVFEQGSLEQKIKGYRVRIYFDNSQQARSEAEAAIEKFKKTYANVPTYLQYTAPYFKVAVGNFLTKEEAIKLWGSILHIFPTSFIISENMTLSSFANQNTAEVIEGEITIEENVTTVNAE